ncbi:hypothetical protein ACHAWF_014544 [Thalassiosira exigua]
MQGEERLSSVIQRVKSNDPTMIELLLNNRDLGNSSHEIELLFDAHVSNSHVRTVSLCNNGLDNTLAAALSLALVDNASINELLLSDNMITSEGCKYLLGTLDSNETVSFVDLNGNDIDERPMKEIDAINAAQASDRNSATSSLPPSVSTASASSRMDPSVSTAASSRMGPSVSTAASSRKTPSVSTAASSRRAPSVSTAASFRRAPSVSTTASSRRGVDLNKPPMHEVPEENDAKLAKQRAIMAIMQDSSIPWQEKNQQILETPQKFYVSIDGTEELAAKESVFGSVQDMIERLSDNDRNISRIELNREDLSRALFDALVHNSQVTFLSLVRTVR